MRKSVVIILTSLVVVSIIIGSAVWYFKPNLFSSQVKQEFRAPTVTFAGLDPNTTFRQTQSFPNAAEFFTKIQNLSDNGLPITMTLSTDKAKVTTPFIKKGETVSGFSYPDPINVYNIEIYISPEIQIGSKEYNYELTRNYLLALLYASEFQKFQKDMTYEPDYISGHKLMHTITMESHETGNFPVIAQ